MSGKPLENLFALAKDTGADTELLAAVLGSGADGAQRTEAAEELQRRLAKLRGDLE
jgi:DNA repair protein RadC